MLSVSEVGRELKATLHLTNGLLDARPMSESTFHFSTTQRPHDSVESDSDDDSDDCCIEAIFDVDQLVSQTDAQVSVTVDSFHFTVTQHLKLRSTGQQCDQDLTESTSTTGAVLWDGAVVAARYVAHNHQTLFDAAPATGQRCVELGCGVGALTGLTLAKMGAEVVLTDMEAVLVPCRATVAGNLSPEEACRVQIEQYCWDAPLLESFEGARLVVTSDTVYDPCLVGPLVRSIHALLRAVPGAHAIVTYDQAIGREAAYAEWAVQAAEWFEGAEQVLFGDQRRQFGVDEDKESVAIWLLHGATNRSIGHGPECAGLNSMKDL